MAWFSKKKMLRKADDAQAGIDLDDSPRGTSDKDESVRTDVESVAYNELQKKIQEKKGNFVIKAIIGKKVKPIVQETRPYPLLTASLFSIVTFSWVNEVIKTGYLRRIEQEDLYPLEGDLATKTMTENFEANLTKRIEQWKAKHPGDEKFNKFVLLLALNDTFKKRFWIQGGMSKIVSDLTQMTMPLLVRALVKYIQHKDQNQSSQYTKGDAIGFAIGISAMLLFNSLCLANFFHGSMLTGSQVKAVLTNIIYKKAFVISPSARFEFPNGKINSLVMADLSRIDFAVGTFHFIWSFPIGFSVGIVILCVNLGAVGLMGVAIILLVIVFIFYVNTQLKKLRIKSLKFIDKRVRAINEIINNLKMIKFYSWEAPYYTIVEGYRSNEKEFILKMQLWKSYMNALISSVTYIATLATFLLLYYTSDNFQAYNIFSSITLLNVLRMPLNLLPMATSMAIDALLSLERVSDLLQAEEGEDLTERHGLEESPNAIEMTKASFQWDVEETEFEKRARLAPSKSQKTTVTAEKAVDSEEKSELGFQGLLEIDLTVARNEVVIVAGSIGTGKTSLLNAIEGSMRKKSGDLKLYGSLTFCSYPWVQNATIRENITFGLEYDEVKYNSIIKACALDVDFEVLPGGDRTEVGERGITLSGGQKARINLARAVYADRDIILLDDVLSAVDARVGRHIMNECICGLLRNKTRILATHQLSLIGSADRVIFLDGSGKIDVGTQDELLARNKDFATLMEYSIETADEKDEEELQEVEELELQRQQTEISRIKSKVEEGQVEKAVEGPSIESRGNDKISLSLYVDYLVLGSGISKYIVVPLFIIGLCANGFLQVFQSVWLSFWISDKFGYSSSVYAGLYGMFVGLATLSYVVLFVLMATVNNNAGLRLFNLSAYKLLKTPMWFMDITPIGRILNRFTKDVDVLDTDMIEQLRLFLTSVSLVGATIILCGIYIPWFFIAVPCVFYIYYLLASYYKSSALDIKRLEANNRSFVFSHFNESLNGMKVIKSYGSQERFLSKYETLIDNMNRAYFLSFSNSRWLSIRLDFVSSLVTLFISIMCVCGVFNLDGSSSGLLVSYIIQVSSMVSLTLRSMTQLENDFNSVERLFEYARDLPEEAAFEIEDQKPDPEWPQEGAIEFEDVSLSYREGLPLVLKHVSFKVNAGEKVGICGRTGAGKSTIMNALFRVNELATGSVTIDDINIAEIGLQDLRSKLSIIPQDPVLFHGTIRQNLDPFNNATDADLWSALRRSWLVEEGAAGLGEFDGETQNIKTFHKFHLDQQVEDDGANFSLGERQLLALARALVRNSKILILDEATSSVDYETDAMIQSTIVNEFRECTILCIAHRLKTILNYDKILVLDKGEVKEFDTPINLFKQGGIFTEMCERSNITEQDFSNTADESTTK